MQQIRTNWRRFSVFQKIVVIGSVSLCCCCALFAAAAGGRDTDDGAAIAEEPTDLPLPIETAPPLPSPRWTAAPATPIMSSPTSATSSDIRARIPGITPEEVINYLGQRGLTCTSPELSIDYYQRFCKDDASLNYTFEVGIYGWHVTTVDNVEAVVYQWTASPSDTFAAEFLGFVASLPYGGAQPDEARMWVENTIPTLGDFGSSETEFAGVKYELYGTPSSRVLGIGALLAEDNPAYAPLPSPSAGPIRTPTSTSEPVFTAVPTDPPAPAVTPVPTQPPPPTNNPFAGCPARTCGSFSSCSEVNAYLAACPSQWGNLDGDGVACESLCG